MVARRRWPIRRTCFGRDRARDVVGHVAEHEAVASLLARPEAESLLGQHAGHRRHETMTAAAFAQELAHAARRLQDVVVVGTARERHRARDGEVARQRQAELRRVGLDRDRKARVQIDEIDVGDRQLRGVERGTARRCLRRARGEVRPGSTPAPCGSTRCSRAGRCACRARCRARRRAAPSRTAGRPPDRRSRSSNGAWCTETPASRLRSDALRIVSRIDALAIPRGRVVGRDLGEAAVHLREAVAVARRPTTRCARGTRFP